ncbi:DUF3445 domain-containing protein [Halovulum dunhuangense]|uniref:DUF3445 domain-containing protein n=1 Tax=Halovulum dunhuangense TaxID=1505036 RepID=A0A849L618_9RHOB|nr:DUF3445 domain-containing protein [Halovulum dunhuangense]NNU81826.1 DUF3445 domain-containing protein [Halovulum dunhuangense]
MIARMVTLSAPPHFPFGTPHLMRRPGLFPMDPADWVQRDAAFGPQMAERDRLVRDCPAEVLGATPLAGPALRELAMLLRGHLPAQDTGYQSTRAGLRRPDGVVVPSTSDTREIGRLCQEDWLLLLADGDRHRLVAGAVCFPSGWRLADKLGQPLGSIHAPVPEYDADLARRVDRIFGALRVEAPVQRINWSVATGPRLFAPPGLPRPPEGDGPCLRIERQTLRRLPESGAVVFTVKTEITPIRALDARSRAAVLAAMDALDPATRAYKMTAQEAQAIRAALSADHNPGSP